MKEATDRHLSSIWETLKRWQDELLQPKPEVIDITRYSWTAEGEELFPCVLQHCPSIEKLYAKFKWLRDDDYKNKVSLIETDEELLSEYNADKEKVAELKAKLSWDEQKLQDCLGVITYYCEQILPEVINASLLNNEYLKHKCDRCP